MSIKFWMDMTILGMVFFFFQATLLLLMQGFAEKGDVEGTLWVHCSVRNMLELSTSAIGDILLVHSFESALDFLDKEPYTPT